MPDANSDTWAMFAGGGTGGHLLPGLAVAEALVERGHDPRTIHFVGGNSGVEATLVPGAGYSLDQLPGRGIQRRLALSNVAAAVGIVRGLVRAVTIVRRRRPHVVVALGGYASLACGLAAVLWRVPIVVLEQNARAGAANRLVGRFARAAAVSFPGTDLPRAVVTGNPLRTQIRAAAEHPDRAGARRELGLPVDRAVVVVFSGSLGSRRINEAVLALVKTWSHRSDLAVRHVAGRRDFADVRSRVPELPEGGLVYQVIEYEDRVDLLLAAADVAVTRAGGTVAELAAMGVPAVLVPLPIATRDHQTANAQVLVDAGAAVIVPDAELTPERLERELDALLADPERTAAMASAMQGQAHLDAAERIAALIEQHARG
ncbi:MAG: UDP-N-acetylglucosamine--N-acetylmuramyl-(pentapeptide) pyrophosphoryl-undecaprenol [Acidimicrobiaceae bacterium]